MKSSLRADYESKYRLAQDLDEVFHAAVVKQFGRNNAGTMRYVSSQHNPETKAAARAYWEAANAMLDAADELRRADHGVTSHV